jgi:ATP-binding cassette subfamily B protein
MLMDLGIVLYLIIRFLSEPGALSLGDFSASVSAMYKLYWELRRLGDYVNEYSEQCLYVERVKKFIDAKPTMVGTVDEIPPLERLTLCNVGFSYPGADNEPVLRHVDLEIRRGERIAFVGYNGAGKTTLIKLLLRLYDPTEGEILLNGQPIRQLRLSSYRALFGCVFQDYQLFGVTVAENVLLDDCQSVEDRAAVNDAIEKSGMSNKISELPAGIDSIVTREFDKDGAVFSGGQAQKLSIARIFARDCEIVILDEPTSALDPIAEQDMYRRMFAACEGKTVIFISHRLSSATMADRIYLFENGSVTETGSHGELLAKNGTYADMWYKQAKAYEEEKNGEEASK